MARRKVAFITGITGQDGSYLAELLLQKGYEVHGMIRRSSNFNTDRIDHLYVDPHEPTRLFLHYGDMTDGAVLRRLVFSIGPDEVYHLAAQSHVMVSYHQPEYTFDVVAAGTLRLLEAVRDYQAARGKAVRFYHASSSEMFGDAPAPQNEATPFRPLSPYAVAKVAAHYHAVYYRQVYGLFVCNGILFNHESERRGETFVSRKITRAVGRIKMGLQRKLYLGNLQARRDWGYAPDYVAAMWRMMQADAPDDYVIATGRTHSVAELLEVAFGAVGLDWHAHVVVDPRYLRPKDPPELRGDASQARNVLGWQPTLSFEAIVRRMVAHDLELARQERTLHRAGHVTVQRGLAHGNGQ